MDVVLKRIHYNLDCFSKIIYDFDHFVEDITPGVFQSIFDNSIKNSGNFTEDLICVKINTKNMERVLAGLKNDLGVYLNDFDEIKKILESAPTEEKVEEWLDELPCHLYTFYNTIINSLWIANLPRYTTVLNDTGKGSLL